MTECKHCGAMLDDEHGICPYCHTPAGQDAPPYSHDDRPEPPESERQQKKQSPPPGGGKQQRQRRTPPPPGGNRQWQAPPPPGGYQQWQAPPPPPGGYQWQPPPPYRPVNRILAGILAIVFGSLGVHKFYLGRIGMGILYLCLSGTGFSTVAGLIEGIIYLVTDEYTFQQKYVRRR